MCERSTTLQPGRHEIFNLGTGTGFSVREVIAAAEQVTGLKVPVVEAPRRAGDPPALVAAAAKARDLLGWVPQKPGLAEILGDAWAFMQSRPDGYDG